MQEERHLPSPDGIVDFRRGLANNLTFHSLRPCDAVLKGSALENLLTHLAKLATCRPLKGRENAYTQTHYTHLRTTSKYYGVLWFSCGALSWKVACMSVLSVPLCVLVAHGLSIQHVGGNCPTAWLRFLCSCNEHHSHKLQDADT